MVSRVAVGSALTAPSPGCPSTAARVGRILTTGAHFDAAYELYAHVHVARGKGTAAGKVATIVAGERPVDLTPEEALADDVAAALNANGILPRLPFERAREAFGPHGVAAMICLIGFYATVCIRPNGLDVPTPEQQGGRPA